ncbi:hypothetical protein Btru_062592 [Bulinus truncatus]|nr:hypothetical protein Btru_062592 [Bulinus truncatus]
MRTCSHHPILCAHTWHRWKNIEAVCNVIIWDIAGNSPYDDFKDKTTMAETAVMEGAPLQNLSNDMDSSSLHMNLSDCKSRLFQTQHGHTKLSSQTMFMEGFNDCATEVLRYLTHVEQLEDNNPMVRDLQCHLSRVKRVFCQESIADMEKLEDDGGCDLHNLNDSGLAGRGYHRSCTDSLVHKGAFPLSPVVSRSASSSVSDATSLESDSIASHSSFANTTCQSVSSDHSMFMANSSVGNHNVSLDVMRHDDVSQWCHYSPCLETRSVQSLKYLANHALKTRNTHTQSDIYHRDASQAEQTKTFPCSSYKNALAPVHYVLPIGQSSPVLPNFPLHHESDHNSFYHPSQTLHDSRQHHLESLSPLVISTNVYPCSEPSSQVVCDNNSTFNPSGLSNNNTSQVTVFSKELAQHVSSVLDLGAGIFPDLSNPSSDVADILLAVETCRFHNDPRVRALADEIIHLIQDDYDDDEVDDDDEDEFFQVDNEDPHRNDESGIEMMDESMDWVNPTDWIEH